MFVPVDVIVFSVILLGTFADNISSVVAVRLDIRERKCFFGFETYSFNSVTNFIYSINMYAVIHIYANVDKKHKYENDIYVFTARCCCVQW